MQLQLTPEEQRDLIFQDGDFYEIISGILTVTVKQDGKTQFTDAQVTQFTFMFESNSGWGTKEWSLNTNGQVNNGPALLVLYRRGNEGNPFAVISMVNRAWTHVVPIIGPNLIHNSTRAAELKKLELKSLAGGIGASILSTYTFGRTKKKLMEKVHSSSYRQVAEQMEATTRVLMFRLGKNAETFWEGGGGGTSSGKL